MFDLKSELRLDLEDAGALPIYRQIYRSVSQAVLEGRLKAGTRLPSARSLAAQLSVARGTVETAYHLLAGEGYIVARGAAGTRVSSDLGRSLLRPAAHLPQHQQERGERPAPPAEPGLFQMGLPALDGFPQAIWSRLLARQARSQTPADLAHPHPAGQQALRLQIAGYLAVARGIVCSPEDIVITGGYQGALGLIAHHLLHPGDRVWLEDPGYPDSREAMRLAGAQVVGVPVDRHGFSLQPVLSKAPPRLVVLTPTHHYPTGVTLSLSRRIALLKWAAENDAWIIEDDYDSEFRYTGKPLPALKSLDRQERVLYAGTFSKVLSPSLRVGYLVVPSPLSPGFRKAAALLQPPPPLLVQATIAAFIEQGHLGRHIRRMRGLYALRRAALARALQQGVGPGLSLELQPGGMHLLAHLPKGTDDVALVARLRQHGLSPSPLSGCGLEAPHAPGLLLGFTNLEPSQATQAAQRLAELL